MPPSTKKPLFQTGVFVFKLAFTSRVWVYNFMYCDSIIQLKILLNNLCLLRRYLQNYLRSYL